MRILTVSVALLLAALTAHQTQRWQSDRALWCDALTLTPDTPRVLNNCALAMMRDGEYAAALPLLTRALVENQDRDPNRREAMTMAILNNRFLVFWALRRQDAARATFHMMNPIDPRTQRFATWFTE